MESASVELVSVNANASSLLHVESSLDSQVHSCFMVLDGITVLTRSPLLSAPPSLLSAPLISHSLVDVLKGLRIALVW